MEVIDPDGRRPLSLSEARTAQSLRLEHAGFYQIHFANGRDAVIGVNPDRRESDLAPIPDDMLEALERKLLQRGKTVPAGAAAPQEAKQPVSLWWYVMLRGLSGGDG